MSESCVTCDGSGTIQIVQSGTLNLAGEWDISNEPYVSHCHSCEMGAIMKEIGIE